MKLSPPEAVAEINEETDNTDAETSEDIEEGTDFTDSESPEDVKEETDFTDSESPEDVKEDTDSKDSETSEDIEEESDAATSEISDETEEEVPRMKTWVKTLLISLGAAVTALFATFAVWYFFATNDTNGIFSKTASNTSQQRAEGFVVSKSKPSAEATSQVNTEADSIADTQAITEEAEVPTAPSDALVYDTISTTRYLTTMAKVHYGNYNLWPYIYEENKSILGHPDRIRPGTAVVIPKLSKFGIDPSKNEDVEKAKKMGVEIYARYGKKI